ncbi:hypothetical protein C8Q76DRAFT_800030 [Earliella scabrosa]|nr:hypothetical protein C8Q76DRAFT_800030 [Earliella scabrosa]
MPFTGHRLWPKPMTPRIRPGIHVHTEIAALWATSEIAFLAVRCLLRVVRNQIATHPSTPSASHAHIQTAALDAHGCGFDFGRGRSRLGETHGQARNGERPGVHLVTPGSGGSEPRFDFDSHPLADSTQPLAMGVLPDEHGSPGGVGPARSPSLLFPSSALIVQRADAPNSPTAFASTFALGVGVRIDFGH